MFPQRRRTTPMVPAQPRTVRPGGIGVSGAPGSNLPKRVARPQFGALGGMEQRLADLRSGGPFVPRTRQATINQEAGTRSENMQLNGISPFYSDIYSNAMAQNHAELGPQYRFGQGATPAPTTAILQPQGPVDENSPEYKRQYDIMAERIRKLRGLKGPGGMSQLHPEDVPPEGYAPNGSKIGEGYPNITGANDTSRWRYRPGEEERKATINDMNPDQLNESWTHQLLQKSPEELAQLEAMQKRNVMGREACADEIAQREGITTDAARQRLADRASQAHDNIMWHRRAREQERKGRMGLVQQIAAGKAADRRRRLEYRRYAANERLTRAMYGMGSVGGLGGNLAYAAAQDPLKAASVLGPLTVSGDRNAIYREQNAIERQRVAGKYGVDMANARSGRIDALGRQAAARAEMNPSSPKNIEARAREMMNSDHPPAGGMTQAREWARQEAAESPGSGMPAMDPVGGNADVSGGPIGQGAAPAPQSIRDQGPPFPTAGAQRPPAPATATQVPNGQPLNNGPAQPGTASGSNKPESVYSPSEMERRSVDYTNGTPGATPVQAFGDIIDDMYDQAGAPPTRKQLGEMMRKSGVTQDDFVSHLDEQMDSDDFWNENNIADDAKQFVEEVGRRSLARDAAYSKGIEAMRKNPAIARWLDLRKAATGESDLDYLNSGIVAPALQRYFIAPLIHYDNSRSAALPY